MLQLIPEDKYIIDNNPLWLIMFISLWANLLQFGGECGQRFKPGSVSRLGNNDVFLMCVYSNYPTASFCDT